MHWKPVVAAWLLQGIQGALGFVSVPRAVDLRQATSELQPKLSKNAIIVLPSDADWDALLLRHSSPRVYPNYNAVVQVATEADVVNVVTIANKYNVPFLTVSGAHGWTETLNKLPYGIQINLRKLNTTRLDASGNTATIGGGAIQYEIVRALYAKGKQAVTGLAECVSGIGPLLGGGHSLLQAQYGFALDNIVSANVVLANGTLVQASGTKNSDLFWALRGAGHNFGVVTSYQLKAYNIPAGDAGLWTVYSLIYTQDKLEALFSLINKFEDSSTTRPTKLALTGVFARIPTVDANNAVIAYTVAYQGTQAEADPYASQFEALGPAATTISTSVNYVALYTVTGNNIGSQACVWNNSITGSGVSLPSWDLNGTRAAFSIFNTATADSRFNNSITLLENYGMAGVRAVNPNTTALAPEERANPILTSLILWWVGNNTQTHTDALTYQTKFKNALYTGVDAAHGKRHAYVNYAIGSESVTEIYGYEAWRQDKLKSLKKSWDPNNKFKWFNPLV